MNGSIKCSGNFKGDGSLLTDVPLVTEAGRNLSYGTDSDNLKELLVNATLVSVDSIAARSSSNLTLATGNSNNAIFFNVNNVRRAELNAYDGSSEAVFKIYGHNNLTTGHSYKINGVIIPQTILNDNGLDLTAGVLKINITDCVSQSNIIGTDIFLLQNSSTGTSKKITGAQLIAAINTNTVLPNNGLDLSSGVLSISISDCVSQSNIIGTDVFV